MPLCSLYSIPLEKLGSADNDPMVSVKYAVVQKRDKKGIRGTTQEEEVSGLRKTDAKDMPSQTVDSSELYSEPTKGKSMLTCGAEHGTFQGTANLPIATQPNEIHKSTTAPPPDVTDTARNNTVPTDHQQPHSIENSSVQGTSPQPKSSPPEGIHKRGQTEAMNGTSKVISGKEEVEESIGHEYESIPVQQKQRLRELHVAAKQEGNSHFYEPLDGDLSDDPEYMYTATPTLSLRRKRQEPAQQNEGSTLKPLLGSTATSETSKPHFYHVLERDSQVEPEEEEEGHYYSTASTPRKGLVPAGGISHDIRNGKGSQLEASAEAPFDDPSYDVAIQTMPKPGATEVPTKANEKCPLPLPNEAGPGTGKPHIYHTLEGPTPVDQGNEYDYCAPQSVLKPKPAATKEGLAGRTESSKRKEAETIGTVEGACTVFDNPKYESPVSIPQSGQNASSHDHDPLFDDPMYAATTGGDGRGQAAASPPPVDSPLFDDPQYQATNM